MSKETDVVVDAVAVPTVPTPSAPAQAAAATTVAPPPGAPEGGRWATVKYGGDKTLLLCLCLAFFCGIFSLCGGAAYMCCPQDEKKVYVHSGIVYDAGGNRLGPTSNFQFV